MAVYNDNKQKQPEKVVAAKLLEEATYVKQAEQVIKALQKENRGRLLTTNKIRNLLTLINELYNKGRYVTENKIDSKLQSHVTYVKMRMVYEAGRDWDVKSFVIKAGLLDYLDQIGDSRDKLILLCHYMEALVAYHKFYTKEW